MIQRNTISLSRLNVSTYAQSDDQKSEHIQHDASDTTSNAGQSANQTGE
jgi:hypothetical protein